MLSERLWKVKRTKNKGKENGKRKTTHPFIGLLVGEMAQQRAN